MKPDVSLLVLSLSRNNTFCSGCPLMFLAEGTVNCLGKQSRGHEAKYSIPQQSEQTTKLLGFEGFQREGNNLV